jgi:hypothetical protein
MSAAILQGILTTTLDTDIWVDLPERQYIRLLNLVVQQGGTALSPTVYVLSDGRVVNFLFSIGGLGSFDREFRTGLWARIEGKRVKVLPLRRILESKKTILRDKDKLHIFLIERFLRGEKRARRRQ